MMNVETLLGFLRFWCQRLIVDNDAEELDVLELVYAIT
jgi:hypothetical protein